MENNITETEAIKALEDFATNCYKRGAKDCLTGIVIVAGFTSIILVGIEAVGLWKSRKELKDIQKLQKEIAGSP